MVHCTTLTAWRLSHVETHNHKNQLCVQLQCVIERDSQQPVESMTMCGICTRVCIDNTCTIYALTMPSIVIKSPLFTAARYTVYIYSQQIQHSIGKCVSGFALRHTYTHVHVYTHQLHIHVHICIHIHCVFVS